MTLTKKWLIGIAILVVIILAITGFLLIQKKQPATSSPAAGNSPAASVTVKAVPTLPPLKLDPECPAGQRYCSSFGIAKCWEVALCP